MHKLRCKRGFTVVELLAALLIVVLLGMVIAAGISVGTQVYRDSIFLSESDILKSTINITLSDVLRYATVVETDGDGNVLTFNSANYNISGGGMELSEEGHLVYYEYAGDTAHELVNRGAYTTLTLTGFSVTYDATTGVFSGSYTIALGDGDGGLLRTAEFSFRSIA